MSSVAIKFIKIKSGSALEVAWASLTRATLDRRMRYMVCGAQYPVL